MRKHKTVVTTVSALCPTPIIHRFEPTCRITFTPRTTPLSAEELAGLEIPEFLKR